MTGWVYDLIICNFAGHISLSATGRHICYSVFFVCVVTFVGRTVHAAGGNCSSGDQREVEGSTSRKRNFG